MTPTLDAPLVPGVPYAAIRGVIRSGDLLLCSGSSPMSRMIQAATDSPWSHVGFVMRLDTLDRVMVLESVESIGVRACTLGSYVADYNGTGNPYPGRLVLARHTHVDLQDEASSHAFSRIALDLLGYPYGTRDILDITVRIVGGKLGMAVRPVRRDRTFICSEFVALVYESIGVRIPYDDLGFIAPKHFARCPEVTLFAEIVPGGESYASPIV